MDDDILAALPHRPPFLFADEIVSRSPEAVVTRYTLRADDDLWSRVYAGHYPGNPLTPGVLLCEMMLQAAAILVHDHCRDGSAGVPVVTRLQEVKFRRIVRPGDQVEIRVQLDERLANAFYLRGSVVLGGKPAAQAAFTVALAAAGGAAE